MAKRPGSSYCEGKRTRDWLKIKTHGRQEFVIVGYTRGEGRRASSFGSLVLAVERDGELRVGRQRRHRLQRADDRASCSRSSSRCERDTSPFASRPEDAEGAQERRRLGGAAARRAR